MRFRSASATQHEVKRANDRFLEAIRPLVSAGRHVPFLCECLDETCTEPMPMTLAEYADVRSHPRRFALRPGHPTAAGEQVVGKNCRFDVTEKPQ